MADDTPPATPAALHPTLTTVSRQVTALSKQLAQTRGDIDGLAAIVKRTREDMNTGLRLLQVPPVGSEPPPAPRPSMAAKAGRTVWGTSKVALQATGALVLVAQLLSGQHPEVTGPLVAALKAFLTVWGQQ